MIEFDCQGRQKKTKSNQPVNIWSWLSLLSTELIHIGGLNPIRFTVRFFDIFRKHPKILLERTPTSKYSDDGENDNDIKISSLSNAYEQMYWPRVDFSRLCTATQRNKQYVIRLEFRFRTAIEWGNSNVAKHRLLIYLLMIFFELATSNDAIIVPHFDSSTVESLWI